MSDILIYENDRRQIEVRLESKAVAFPALDVAAGRGLRLCYLP